MKYICKDFWTAVYKKQIDNLRTNHQVCIWLIDHITCLFCCFIATKVKFSRHWILCLVGKKGCFPSQKIWVWNFENSRCPMEQYIMVPQTRAKVLRVWLLHLFPGYKRAVLGTTVLSNGITDISVWPSEMTRLVKLKWTTFKGDPNYFGRTKLEWSIPFDF